MELLFLLNELEELDDAPYGKSYAISVLLIGDVKRYSTVLHFAREKREVYLVGYDEKRGIINGADKGIELVKLLIYKRGSPKSNRIIRLWP